MPRADVLAGAPFIGGMRSGGRGTGGHGADQHVATRRTTQLLAMLPSTPAQIRIASTAAQLRPVRVGPRQDTRLDLAGAGQRQDSEIVGVVQVVELGRPQDLRFLVEGGVIAKVQVIEVAELIERDDVGDFVAVEFQPAVARLPSAFWRKRPCKAGVGQPDCPSERNHNVIWTLRR
jgi:hypothetical protein